MDRDAIYRLVRSRDPNGLISKRSIAWEQSSKVDYLASEHAWNGRGYQCYFCAREFRQLHGLNQHLNSTAHREALYHCPNRNCGMDFKSLAAVINHLESESCGAMRFETVQNRIGDIISGNRLLRF
ncbi:280e8c18-3a02-4e49-8051-f5970dec81f8 [Thermothielavioides terrestris]|uniref:280e8c18-3a02-4e49-8051-f5970dec81f8 n=1 Tax=Thermothielavioides terrestris TaxID=2587410 RepID=A0A3S4AWE8_9PEZI|nr:280e8c18-3a02-4e49-8051-f5970dec81f8 [Thermothielavioides terrestris]